MAAKLTQKQIALLTDGKNFASVGTLMPDGSPQVTPVWIDWDGSHVVFNTEEKRAKVRNLKRDPRLTVTVLNEANPYEYVEIRGRVVDMTTDGAAAHIDKMAKKYLGQDKYPLNQPGDVRVIVKIEPERVSGMR
jgi:PPOX class probable F420-dependent enzyme